MAPPPGFEGDFGTTLRLVDAAQKGDSRALEDLFTRYLPRVRQIVALRLGRKLRQLLEVEDVVQETLLVVLRGLHRFEARDEGSFRNWLARCVECEIATQARKHGAKKRGAGKALRFGDRDATLLHSSMIAAPGASPSQLARARELSERIEAALLDMPEHSRELIVLRNLCGMSYAEVAAALGFARESSARVAYFRALKKLKEKVGAD
ncbi:MAG: sigma-70 family RNA polymerase sigma factor [Planctomycetes bacterium]|nr:sigma-70 family RNA polymerase sigma factor [Planctomycetota bacterium]